MTTKRSVKTVVMGASALSIVAIAMGTTAVAAQADSHSIASRASVQNSQSLTRSADSLDVGLVGTASAFLALGFGTAAVAHRRRWSNRAG